MNDQQTCGNCRFRGPSIEAAIQGNAEGEGRYPICLSFDERDDTEYFLCERIKQAELKRGQGATVVDGSGYYAALCVETDFACNKWERKA